MPNTYVALRTETVAVATNTVTFSLSGISGYTDLRLVARGVSSGGDIDLSFRLNGDTGSNYSRTFLWGSGSTAGSGRSTGLSFGRLNYVAYWTTSNESVITADFMNYSNTTTFKTVLSRDNNSAVGVGANINLWRSTAAITSIEIYTSAFNFAVGSTFNLYGIANADQGAAKATGGIITEDSTYWYHTFGASGTFTPKQALTCDYLVVAGGGGGGGAGSTWSGAGGGGGGQVRTGTSSVTTTNYPITVGGGGPGGVAGSPNGSTGTTSVFNSITSSAGLGGIGVNGPGNNGGNSGGGFTGGTGAGSTAPGYGGGGGGGSSANGINASGTVAGIGGAGTSTTFLGVTSAIGGGGGGGLYGGTTSTTQGLGVDGGANGNAWISGNGSNGNNAAVNRAGGGGGAGGGNAGSLFNGGAGGSGIVVIRYSK